MWHVHICPSFVRCIYILSRYNHRVHIWILQNPLISSNPMPLRFLINVVRLQIPMSICGVCVMRKLIQTGLELVLRNLHSLRMTFSCGYRVVSHRLWLFLIVNSCMTSIYAIKNLVQCCTCMKFCCGQWIICITINSNIRNSADGLIYTNSDKFERAVGIAITLKISIQRCQWNLYAEDYVCLGYPYLRW